MLICMLENKGKIISILRVKWKILTFVYSFKSIPNSKINRAKIDKRQNRKVALENRYIYLFKLLLYFSDIFGHSKTQKIKVVFKNRKAYNITGLVRCQHYSIKYQTIPQKDDCYSNKKNYYHWSKYSFPVKFQL